MKLNINGKIVEVKDEDLTKAIDAKQESMEITIPDVTIRTVEEDSNFKTNIETASKPIGIEIGRKEVLKRLGIDVEGAHKSDDKTIEAINTFTADKVATALTDAKIEPGRKVTELQADKERLQATNEDWKVKYSELEKSGVVKDQRQTKLNTFAKGVPANSLNSPENTITIMDSMLKTGFTETGVMFGIGEDGKPMKDVNQNLLPMDKVISNFFDQNDSLLTKASGGAGGGDAGGGGDKQSLDDFIEEQKKEGNSVNSPKFNEAYASKQKAGTLE